MKMNEYWDDIHKKYNSSYDGWFDKYISLINKKDNILELGCGRAYVSNRLFELGYRNVVASDFSEEALRIVRDINPSIKTMNIDITSDIHFEDESINVLVADLCLHYFDSKTTALIIKKLYNLLSKNGYLIARVNSVNDNKFKDQKEIEPGYYFDGLVYRKFFDSDELRKLLSDFDICYLEEEKMDRYEKNKILIEFCAQKK